MSASYGRPYGAMAIYYGTNVLNGSSTVWPAVCGGGNNALAFLGGLSSTLAGSNLAVRDVRAYSNIGLSQSFATRRSGLSPSVFAVGIFGMNFVAFPNFLLSPSPWQGVS